MKLIGCKEVKRFVNYLRLREEGFKATGMKPDHLVIDLPAGYGQSTVTEYVADALYDHGILKKKAINKVLEYSLDGSLRTITNLFDNIQSNAVYSNNYEGVVAIDITRLSECVGEDQSQFFFDGLMDMSEKTFFIIFMDPSVKHADKLKERACTALQKFSAFGIKPYDADELALIAMEVMKVRGVRVNDDVIPVLAENISNKTEICSAKDVKKLADELVLFSDFQSKTPTLDEKEIEAYFKEISDLCREEVKR